MDTAANAARSIDIGRVISKRWPLILVSAAVTLAAAAAYFVSAQRIYKSSVEILVIKKDSSATSVSGGQSSEIQSDVVEDVLATHIRLFGSTRVVLQAIDSHELNKLPGIAAQVTETCSAADYILDSLEVARGGEGQAKDAQVLNAAFSHTEPEEARVVLGAMVDSYQNFLAETFDTVGSEALGLIEDARDELGASLDTAEAEYSQFRQEAPVMFTGEDSIGLHERELVDLAAARAQLKMQKSVTESRLSLMLEATRGSKDRRRSPSECLALIDDEHVQRLGLLVNVERGDAISEAFQADQPERSEAANAEYDRLVSLRTEAGLLRAKFGDRHPRVAEVADSIAELEGFLSSRGIAEAAGADKLEPSKVVEAYIALLENDLLHIDRRIAETEAVIAEVSSEAKAVDAFKVQDKMLTARLERKQDLYNAVVARIPELGMATDFGGFITPVITPVTVAKQVWPNLLILGALAIALGVGGGLGLALWSELSDQTFQSADEVADAIKSPVLGVVPRLTMIGDAEKASDSAVDPKVVALHRARSAEAEAIRSVRTALFFASQGGERRVVQFTSPTPADGKSLMSANVAVALANAGKSVLLVDADLRKPTQHELFGVDARTQGLADLLVEQAEFPDVVRASGIENLELLPAGTLPPNPAELLSMPRFDEFLQARREQYDYVIVDTPPVLIVSDPLSVASLADGVILVTPIKQNTAGAAGESARMLDEVGASLIGTVVNDLEGRLQKAARAGYGVYGRYGQSYGYLSDASGYTSSSPTTTAEATPGSVSYRAASEHASTDS